MGFRLHPSRGEGEAGEAPAEPPPPTAAPRASCSPACRYSSWYAFYPDGSRQTITTPAGVFSSGYDAVGRMNSLVNPFAEASAWTYRDNGWLLTRALGNGAVSTYTQNPLGQVTHLTTGTGGGTVLSQFGSILHDAAGNRTSLTASLPAYAAYNGATTWGYDTKDQLLQEQSARNGGWNAARSRETGK